MKLMIKILAIVLLPFACLAQIDFADCQGKNTFQGLTPVDVLFQYGQSDMVGFGDTIYLTESQKAVYQNIFIGPYLENYHAGINSTEFPNRWGAELPLSEYLLNDYDTVYIFKSALGGSGLSNGAWDPDKPGGQYKKMVNEWNKFIINLNQQGKYPRVIMSVWMQGVTDSNFEDKSAVYYDKLATLDLQTRCFTHGYDYPFYIASNEVEFTYKDTVNNAKIQYANEKPNTYFISKSGLSFLSPSLAHLDSQGLFDFANLIIAIQSTL